MGNKPSLPRGTRDFNSELVAKRHYIINIIRQQFENFGFQPIETPSFENLDTLLGKYGSEGDRLIFKILNSGDYLSKISDAVYTSKEASKITPLISKKALRYDLTIPFARYVVQHQNEIVFPFKRYQLQLVWRADNPQKGRYREFLQCDADIVGATSLWQEIELIQLYDAVFTDLKIKDVVIKINHRKILAGIAEVIGAEEDLIDFTVALDKLDKIGEQKVKEELIAKNFSEESIQKLQPLFSLEGDFDKQLSHLKTFLGTSKIGLIGIEELEFIKNSMSQLPLQTSKLQLEVTLARGLDYYTGAIIEVTPPKPIKLGAIGGGGRYDNLTENFGLKGYSGVGISFGLDRIYLVLEALGLFPQTIVPNTKVLFINFGDAEAVHSHKAIQKLRGKGISAELYPLNAKPKKQFNYADKRAIPYVVIVGEEELKKDIYTLKTMDTGRQQELTLQQLLEVL